MKKLTFILCALLVVLAGCGQSSENDLPPNNGSNPALTLDTGTNTEDKDQEDNSISTQLSTTQFNFTYKENGKFALLNEIHVTDKQTLLSFYQKNEENVYASLKLGQTTYDIGQIRYDPAVKEYPVESVNVSSQSYIKLTGACGANCPISDYVSVDTSPPTLLHIEANTVEADIDGDGLEEIVATVGTAAETTIYKLQDGKVLSVNLNQVMNANVVIYDQTKNVFQAEVVPGELSTWEIKDGQILLIP